MGWSLWYPYTLENIKNAPEDLGVYAFGDGKYVIYYGKAEQDGGIRARLLQHWNNETNKCIKDKAINVSWNVDRHAAAAERGALEGHRKQYGDLPECNQMMPRR